MSGKALPILAVVVVLAAALAIVLAVRGHGPLVGDGWRADLTPGQVYVAGADAPDTDCAIGAQEAHATIPGRCIDQRWMIRDPARYGLNADPAGRFWIRYRRNALLVDCEGRDAFRVCRKSVIIRHRFG